MPINQLKFKGGIFIFKKPSNLDGIHHWPGIYKFVLPYTVQNVPLSDGLVPVYTCDVEMHIGGHDNLSDELIATVIIGARKEGVGVTNFIEEIAKLVKEGYLDKIVKPANGPIHNRIRWIERNYYPLERYQVVTLEWDSENKIYHSPSWVKLLESDWILINNRMAAY